MDSIDKLKSSLKESLINRGILNEIKAHMRQEIFNILDNDNDINQRPKLTRENIIINELIKEYFIFNGYNFSSKVLQSEVGQSNSNFNRNNIIKELNIIENENNKNKPLLYTILSGLKNKDDNLIPIKIDNDINIK
jgi:lisH domain-containing protein FOPNL